MGPSRRIFSCDSVTDFLRQILYHNEAHSTTLLVCSTREHFLEQLVAAIRAADGNAASEGSQLLTKTIGLLSQSSKIKLVFCPTLENLRAYISVLSMANTESQESNLRPLLGVLNLLALHRSTSEFSAQGLSRTLAAAVEVTARQGVDLVLCECLDAADSTDGEREALWSVQVPLLNQTARTGIEESTVRGGNVTVKRVAQRWFEFNEDD